MSESELFLVHYSFGHHGHESVAMIPQIRTQAEGFLSPDPSVRNIIMFEDAHLKDSDSQRIKDFKDRGYSNIDSYLHAVYSAQRGRTLTLPPKELPRGLLFLVDCTCPELCSFILCLKSLLNPV